MPFRTKRIHELPSPSDGVRVLIDRLWPRGVSKANASINGWMKEVAPSERLRKWFDHDPDKWDGFQRSYRAELDADPARLGPLLALGRGQDVTLLYAARDEKHNHAIVLHEYLTRMAG